MKQKKYFIKLMSLLVLLIIPNVMTGYLTKNKFTGDLGRLGTINFGEEYANKFKTEKKIYYFEGNLIGKNIEIVTIGDSFSQQGSIGYQNSLSKLTEKKIGNIKRLKEGKMQPLETLLNLLDSGYLDKIKPEYVIFESVERYFVDGVNKSSSSQKINLEEINKYYEEIEVKPIKGVIEYLNGVKNNKEEILFSMANYKYLINNIFYRVTGRSCDSVVYQKEIKMPLFSVKEDKLYFYFQDIEYNFKASEKNINEANLRLNQLNKSLNEKGIKLIVIPAVNKYTLYQDYIKKNNYSQSIFFDNLRKVKKDYIFIDTYEILLNEVKKGKKDIFYANNTHWSHLASKKVAESIKENLEKQVGN